MTVDGKPVDVTGHADSALQRLLGIAHVPEDRHRMGLVVALEENENAILGYHEDTAYLNGPFLDTDAIRTHARKRIEQYDIRPPDCRLKTENFSGGNQQKIVLAREMERSPKVLLVGQPTRGVDIGAIEFIHRQLVAMRDAGAAILLVSVELDEIRSLADRILVMCGGRVVGERGPEASEQELGLMMAGLGEPEAEAASAEPV
jgi:simple sugar transport system ATP-binding protein